MESLFIAKSKNSKDILHSDETTVQVLHEPRQASTFKSYMWRYHTGGEDSPIVLYDYQKTRAGEHTKQFLKGFKGYLHVDRYAGYHKVSSVTLVGCFVHALRKFDETLKVLPESKRHSNVTACEGLNCCNKLFAIDRDLKECTPEERYEKRLECRQPVLETFSAWLNTQKSKVIPKSLLGKAITYCLNQREKLVAFLEDGRLEIDNNRSERSIKPFIIGRKNLIFSNTPKGAKASLIINSIMETAKENNLILFIIFNTYLRSFPTWT